MLFVSAFASSDPAYEPRAGRGREVAAPRPATIDTSVTPLANARRQAPSFATMPECATPDAIIASMAST